MITNLTDQEIIIHLIQKDSKVTRWFFYEKCRPLLLSLMRSLFDHPVDYDEMVNSAYLLLMEDDARRLRSFEFKCTLCQWLKVVCVNYLTDKRDEMIDNETDGPLYDTSLLDEPVDVLSRSEAEMDVERLFAAMKSKREVYVIKRLMLDDAPFEEVAEELGVSVDYLYVLKKRAMQSLIKLATNDGKPSKNMRTKV